MLRKPLNLGSTALLLMLVFTPAVTGQTAQSKMLGPQFPVYVGFWQENAILKVDSLGTPAPFTSGGLLSTPEGLAFDANGNLYVANRGGANIIRIDQQGYQSVFVGPHPLLPVPVQFLAFDSAGYLYAAGAYTDRVVRVDSQGNPTVFTEGGYIHGCQGIVFDSTDTLYVASVYNYRIVKVDGQGNQSVFVSDFLHSMGPWGDLGPLGLAFDSVGNLYGGNQAGTIVRVDAAANQTTFAQLPSAQYPAFIAIDGSDSIYVGDYYGGGPVTKITASGVQSVFLSRSYPSGLAFTNQLTALGPAEMWIGLKNSDDVGTRFDLLAEVLKNGSPVGSGTLNGVSGGSSGFGNAVLRTINLALSSPVSVSPGDTLSMKLSVRIAVGVAGHSRGTARLWFNDAAANSRFDSTINGVTNDYFLLDGFTLDTSAGGGPKKSIDVLVDKAVGGNPFKPFGTWSKTF